MILILLAIPLIAVILLAVILEIEVRLNESKN